MTAGVLPPKLNTDETWNSLRKFMMVVNDTGKGVN